MCSHAAHYSPLLVGRASARARWERLGCHGGSLKLLGRLLAGSPETATVAVRWARGGSVRAIGEQQPAAGGVLGFFCTSSIS